MEVVADGGCFVCGKDNPGGLQAVFKQEPETRSASCDLSLTETFQGWQGIVHGGLLATLLDETAVYACRCEVDQVVTAELQVKYKQPAKVGVTLRVFAKVRERKRNLFTVDAEVRQEEQLIAQAEVRVFALAQQPKTERNTLQVQQ